MLRVLYVGRYWVTRLRSYAFYTQPAQLAFSELLTFTFAFLIIVCVLSVCVLLFVADQVSNKDTY